MSVDFSQLVEFRDRFERLSNEFETFLKQFLIKQALDVLAKTKSNTPTDTGLLKNSWTIGDQTLAIGSRTNRSGETEYFQVDSAFAQGASLDSVVRQGDMLVITISNNVEYAKYVEYGHMTRGRSKWVNGKFMCSLAIIDVKRKIPARFEREFSAWFAEKMREN
ncbi:MAG: HK97 gp10 family phage protein [Peptoanaerobacter stomatis]